MAALAVAMLCGTVLAVLPASAASATTTYCNTKVTVSTPGPNGSLIYVPGNGSTWKCSLFEGDGTNDGVRALQDAINVCYIAKGYLKNYGVTTQLTEDGNFGAHTETALIGVQKYVTAHGNPIAADGDYGQHTYNAMSFPGSYGLCFWASPWAPW